MHKSLSKSLRLNQDCSLTEAHVMRVLPPLVWVGTSPKVVCKYVWSMVNVASLIKEMWWLVDTDSPTVRIWSLFIARTEA